MTARILGMARMLGAMSPEWCRTCQAPPGPDCWSKGVDRRTQRKREGQALEREFAAWRDHPDIGEFMDPGIRDYWGELSGNDPYYDEGWLK